MSDFSPTLRRSFIEEFPEAFQGKCFYHLKQNVKKRYRKLFKHLENYIDHLGNCNDDEQLNLLWKIIQKDIKNHNELKNIAPEFIQYFEKEYMNEDYRGWYIGALPPGFGNTNNILEGHHRYLKDQIFDYKTRDISKVHVIILFICFRRVPFNASKCC